MEWPVLQRPLRAHLLHVGLFAVAIMILVGVVTALLPKQYAATARVMLPPKAAQPAELASLAAAQHISLTNRNGSRMLLVQHVSTDPRAAASVVNDFVSANTKKPMVVIDRASVPVQPVGPNLALNLAYGAVGALALGIGFILLRERRRRSAMPAGPERFEPSDAEVTAASVSGSPSRAEAGFLYSGGQDHSELCRRLLESWFNEHRLLAVTGPVPREQRAAFAARLAVGFAGLGEKTLLVDAGASAPEGVRIKPVDGFDNLFLLLAPRDRLASYVSEAGRRFPVVLIASADGDDQFAALAGGTLIVASPDDADSEALQQLEGALARLPARVVETVFDPS
jgi:hypothetical protein